MVYGTDINDIEQSVVSIGETIASEEVFFR